MARRRAIDFDRAAESLRVLAHPGRLALVRLLLDGRRPVGALARAAGLAPNVTSEHLRLLERCGLLASEREGRRVYYRVAADLVVDVVRWVEGRFAA